MSASDSLGDQLRREYDVVVVGAGPAGLAAAIQLAHMAIDVLVIDRRGAVSGSPRAVGVSLRQMEVFRSWGVDGALREASADVDLAVLRTTTACAAASGTRVPINVPTGAQSEVVSPAVSVRVPQDHLERILGEYLAGLPTGTVARPFEAGGLRQDDGGVFVDVRPVGGGVPRTVRARYLIAADGAHSAIRDRMGIAVDGTEHVMRGVNAEFRAPLWEVLGEHRYALYTITDEAGSGVLIPAGSDDRWQFGMVLRPEDDPSALGASDAVIARVRAAAGVPDLPVRILRTGTFTSSAMLAHRFSSGRVYLVGDAAHRVSPRGGNGLAMAVRGGLALGWRMAWVLRGWAPPEFLRTYEQEVHPVAADDVARAAAPEGRCHAVVTEMMHDLGGRIPHAWAGHGISTLDLLSHGLTLFVGDGARHWDEATTRTGRAVSVHLVRLGPAAARALGLLQPDAALLVRPDGAPLARWGRAAGVAGAAADLTRAIDDLIESDPVPPLPSAHGARTVHLQEI